MAQTLCSATDRRTCPTENYVEMSTKISTMNEQPECKNRRKKLARQGGGLGRWEKKQIPTGEGEGEVAVFSAKRWDRRSS